MAKPVVLVVDGEPRWPRAVQRDPRHRCALEYAEAAKRTINEVDTYFLGKSSEPSVTNGSPYVSHVGPRLRALPSVRRRG
jgi:hypothetical protein